MQAWLRRSWRELAALALITALAAFLRFWQLAAIPPGFHYDEALEALEAWRVVTRPDYHPVFFPGDFGLPAMFIYLESLAFRLLPAIPAVSRGVAALIGVLTVPALYALGQEMLRADERLPRSLPLLAAAVLAISRWHITFSRIGIEPILVPLFLTLVLWVFFVALRTNRPAAWLGLGAVLGLSVYTYPAAWLMLPLMAGAVLYVLVVAPKRLTGRVRGLGLAGLGLAVAAAPLALFFIQHPDALALRSGQVAIIAPGQPLLDMAGSLGANLLKALGVFSVAGDIDPRNNIPGQPALDPLVAVPFYLGLMLAVWRWKRPVTGILLLAGGAMLLATAFSEYAPHFRRALGVTPVAALFAGLGLALILGRPQEKAAGDAYVPRQLRESGWEAGELSARMDRLRWWGRVTVVAAILIGSAIYTAVAYFDIWGGSNALYYAYDQGLWEIGEYVRGLPEDEPVYLSPRPQTDMTLAFAWRAGREVRRFDGRHALVIPGAGRSASYIFIEHEDYRGPMLLHSLYPEAVAVRSFLDRAGRTYAQVFRVADPGAIARRPQVEVGAQWPGITLVGYDIDQTMFEPGQRIYLQLWWRADAGHATDWTVFTHVLGPPKPDGHRVWAGLDSAPGQGSVPTRAWAVGDLILDEYQIVLPPDMPAGAYQIEVGLYDPWAEGQRLPLIDPAGQDYLILGEVQVE